MTMLSPQLFRSDPTLTRSIAKVFAFVATLGALPGLVGLFFAAIMAVMAPIPGLFLLAFTFLGFRMLFEYITVARGFTPGTKGLWITTAIYNAIIGFTALSGVTSWAWQESSLVGEEWIAALVGPPLVFLWYGGLVTLAILAAKKSPKKVPKAAQA